MRQLIKLRLRNKYVYIYIVKEYVEVMNVYKFINATYSCNYLNLKPGLDI